MDSKRPSEWAMTRRAMLRGLVFASNKPLAEEQTRTLVVVFLRGGADTLNMVVPYGEDRYYRMRPTLAIGAPGKSEGAIRIDDFYGFHPELRGLEGMFKEGRLACVQGVGSDNATGSHFSAQDQIEHGEGGASFASGGLRLASGEKKLMQSGGWLGRYLRELSGGAGALSAVAIGSAMPESLRGAPTASVFETLEALKMSLPAGEDPAQVAAALSRMYGAQVGVLGERGGQTLELLRRVEGLRNASGGNAGAMAGGAMTASLGLGADGSAFSRGLGELARLIEADVGLRVGCIDLPGWDTHFVQGGTAGLQAGLIKQLGDGLAGFDAALGSHRGRVTTVVMTEFGRRLYENASLGTDHGRGFCMLLMGAGVAGGRVIGGRPGFEEGGYGIVDADVAGPGGLKVETDYRAVLGEVLRYGGGAGLAEKVFGVSGKGVGVMAGKRTFG